MEKNYSVTIKESDVKTDLTSSGQVIDVIAMAMGYDEYNDLENFDGVDGALAYVRDNYNYEDAFIKALNAKPELMTGDNVLSSGILMSYHEYEGIQEKAGEPTLLAGAWLALNFPEQFETVLADWKEKVIEASSQFYNEPEELPADLLKELETAEQEQRDSEYKEWLHGDFRNWAGILRLACREFEADRVAIEKNGSVRFEWDVDGAGAFLSSYGDDEDNEKPISQKRMKELLCDRLESKASEFVNKKEEDAKKRKEERERLAQYQGKQRAEAREERRQKLLAMKK